MKRRSFLGNVAAAVMAVAIGLADARPRGGIGLSQSVVNPPSGFRWSSPPISIYRSAAGALFTGFDIASLIPAVITTYYVNPLTGSDANNGTSAGTPLLNLATALAKSDVDQIQIIGLTGDFIALGNKSWNNTQPSRSLSVLNRTGHRYLSLATASSSVPTWTVNGSFSNVYQTPATNANACSVVDLKTKSVLTYVNGASQTVSCSYAPSAFPVLVQVASIAAVAATPGTFFCDNTNVYVQSYDSRNLVGDTFMYPCNTVNNGRFPSVNNCTIYIENVDFIGGRPFYMLMASSVTGCVLALNGCSFQGGNVNTSGGYNGLTIQCFGSVYAVNCGAYNNGLDGFNYHSFEGDGTTSGTSPSIIEINSVAIGNGTTGSGGSSDNATTAHDQCNVIRLNCVYINTADRGLIDIDNSQSWNLGCFVGPSTIGNTGGENIVSGGGVAGTATSIWIDTCYAPLGSFPRWASITPSGGSAALNYFNSGPVVNSGSNTGAVTPYVG